MFTMSQKMRWDQLRCYQHPQHVINFMEMLRKSATNKPGYRKINLLKSGKIETKVVRID